MKKTTWSPAKFQMGLARTSRAPLSRLAPKKAVDTAVTILDLVVGGSLAVALYTVVSPRSVLPNTPIVGAHPEAALILGLLASGTYWFATGENVTALSGAAATAFIYGLAKIAFQQ
jgi:hypothetical protein